jgi:hypothetical protein
VHGEIGSIHRTNPSVSGFLQGKVTQMIRAWLTAIWKFLKSRLWQIATAVLLAIVVLSVVKPFQAVQDPAPEDVAIAWNSSIGRLGILPLYPPTEDFGVGDVLAVVADSENVTLLRKAVRIAHLDLHDLILSSAVEPAFAETADPVTGTSLRKQDRFELPADPASKRIALSISAFPGITINHVLQSNAGAANATGWFGSSHSGQRAEEIRIKGVESYGVSTIEAIVRLNRWCSDAKTKAYCDDSFVRQALAFAVSDRVLATKDSKDGAPNEYASRLELQLVTRVFLTREIQQRRLEETAGGAAIQALADPSTAKPASNPASDKPADQDSGASRVSSAIDALNKGLVASGVPGAKISIVRSDDVDISLKETFQRPIAFGYRAVTIALQPAAPGKGRVP